MRVNLNLDKNMKNTKDRELIIFEKGFEEGYQVAKRLYKPFSIEVLSEDEFLNKERMIRQKYKIIYFK